jgi:type IV pilus assembly protein PilY1
MTRFLITLAILALLMAGLASAPPGWARAPAPVLNVPPAPPGQFECMDGWQTAARTVGIERGGGYLLEADFDLAQRTGRLLRRDFAFSSPSGAAGNAGVPQVGAVRWDAASQLDGGSPAPADRRIYTLSTDGVTLPFAWNSLGPSQKSALDPLGDSTGSARLDYLRGVRAGEGTVFRKRASLLGDIVRSAPLLVSAPEANIQGADYAAFYKRFRQRDAVVYVGANDGMLHAFDWTTGAERFAYIPAALLPRLAKFADPASAAVHEAYVDGALTQSAALVAGQWRSVLVGAMGMGATGLFVLDVTDPGTGPQGLWEFTEHDDSAMGHIHAPPQIVKLRVDGPRLASADRFFVLVSSGINPAAGADGALFLLSLDKPAGTPWRRGENYYRLPAPARDPAASNVLAPPVVAVDIDGAAHAAWAGDSQGTLWHFSLTGLARAGGGSAGMAARARPLFRARSADGQPQAITEAPRVVFAPGGGFLLLFGTGKSIEPADVLPSSFATQSFYAVRDRDLPLNEAATAPVLGRAALAERRMVAGSGTDAFTIEGQPFDFNGAGKGVRQGWFFDYPRSLQDGERTAAAPQLSGSVLVISTSAPGAQPCAPIVRAYVVDSLTGLSHDRRGVAAPGGQTGRAMDGSDGSLPYMLAGAALPGTPAARLTPTGAVRGLRSLSLFSLPASGAGVLLDQISQLSITGRLSWREVANWRELHASGPPPVPAPPPAPP